MSLRKLALSDSGLASISPHSCQVRNRGDIPCLAAPVVEASIVLPSPEGMTQRTVRCCPGHFEKLAQRGDNQILATRPYVRNPE